MLLRIGIRNVLAAENGREALDILNNAENVDLVLTDMSMPVMNGAELAGEIRKMPKFANLPIYVITADVEMQTEYKKQGFNDMLIKPVTLDKLKELLAKFSSQQQDKADAK